MADAWDVRHEPPVVGTGALDTAYFADTIPESDDIVHSDCLAHKLRIVRPIRWRRAERGAIARRDGRRLR